MPATVAVEVRLLITVVLSTQYYSSLDRVPDNNNGSFHFAAAKILASDLVRPTNTDADRIHSGQTIFLGPSPRWAVAL